VIVKIPQVPFGNSDLSVTRLISGGNPLCGNSHLSPELNEEMRDYFTPEQVVAYLHDLQAAGINTVQARGDYHRILHWIELFRREGGKLHWIAQTASEMADVFQNIRVIAAAGAIGIYHHGSRTDKFWFEGEIDRVNDYLKAIRDTGCQVGLGTHIPEVLDYAENKGWDIDFYMACFYNISTRNRESALVDPNSAGQVAQERFEHDDRIKMCRQIMATEKTCLAFKILAASRLCQTEKDVRDAFAFAFSNIKARDAVVVGMFPKHTDQIEANVLHTIESCRA